MKFHDLVFLFHPLMCSLTLSLAVKRVALLQKNVTLSKIQRCRKGPTFVNIIRGDLPAHAGLGLGTVNVLSVYSL